MEGPWKANVRDNARGFRGKGLAKGEGLRVEIVGKRREERELFKEMSCSRFLLWG